MKTPVAAANRPELTSSVESIRGDGRVVGFMIGIDRFKDVNSAFGHVDGDFILNEIACRLASMSAEQRTVARPWGDVFAVFESIPLNGVPGIARRVERIRAVFTEPFQTAGGVAVQLSATIGVDAEGVGTRTAQALVRNAEIALHRAKAQRLRWALYKPVLDEQSATRLSRIAELRAAIANHEFVVHYQPILNLETRRPVSVEALVRWQHPERGLVAPGEFIELAEESGLIGDLTQLVVSDVARQVRIWCEAGRRLTCAVNISAHCLRDRGCSSRLLRALEPVSTSVSIEVTESAMADGRAVAALNKFAAAGISSAIDDFGTGYSSLATLKALPTSTLKIDRSLISDVEFDQRDFDLVKGAVLLARSYGLDVIAEGIETERAAERLREAGVVKGQGFWFAEPMPAEELEKWLDRRSSSAFASDEPVLSTSGGLAGGRRRSSHD